MLKPVGATQKPLSFVIKLLKEHKLSVADLTVLRYGSPLNNLKPKEAMSFCDEVASFGTDGARQALEILYMYCFGTPNRFEQCKEQFIAIISKKNLLSDDADKLDIHTWSELVKKYISDSQPEFSEYICKELLAFCSSHISDKLDALRQLKDITAALLKNMYEIVWPYFGNAILEKDNWEVAFGVKHLLKIECGDVKETEESPLVQMPYDYLQSWCQQNTPEGPAAIIRLLPIVWEEDANYGIDVLSRKLLLDFGNHEEVQHAAASQIFNFSSWGSREPYFIRRSDVLNELKHLTESRSLKTWIDTIMVHLKKEAQESKAIHDEFEAGIIR